MQDDNGLRDWNRGCISFGAGIAAFGVSWVWLDNLLLGLFLGVIVGLLANGFQKSDDEA
ncbi:MAG: hypothetical protein AAF830_07635 [Pseudomonadota bacterium]